MQFTSQDFEGRILKIGIYIYAQYYLEYQNKCTALYSLEDLNVRRAS